VLKRFHWLLIAFKTMHGLAPFYICELVGFKQSETPSDSGVIYELITTGHVPASLPGRSHVGNEWIRWRKTTLMSLIKRFTKTALRDYGNQCSRGTLSDFYRSFMTDSGQSKFSDVELRIKDTVSRKYNTICGQKMNFDIYSVRSWLDRVTESE